MTPAVRHLIRAAVIAADMRDPGHNARFYARCARLRAMSDTYADTMARVRRTRITGRVG